MYDPTIGRWISEDPLGFQAADANLYRYVANRPTMESDPSGLQMQGPPPGADWAFMQDLMREARANPQNQQLRDRMGLIMGLMGNRNHVYRPTADWARAALVLAQADPGMTQERLVQILGGPMPVPRANGKPESQDIADTRAQSSLQLPLYGMDGNRTGAEAAGESRAMIVQMGKSVATDVSIQGASVVAVGPMARALRYLLERPGNRLVRSLGWF